jgi:hypothetical protein
VEDAIRDGVIYWHAFPFNAQLEFMDEELLRTSVQLTHDLDARFGYLPKMTLSQVSAPRQRAKPARQRCMAASCALRRVFCKTPFFADD